MRRPITCLLFTALAVALAVSVLAPCASACPYIDISSDKATMCSTDTAIITVYVRHDTRDDGLVGPYPNYTVYIQVYTEYYWPLTECIALVTDATGHATWEFTPEEVANYEGIVHIDALIPPSTLLDEVDITVVGSPAAPVVTDDGDYTADPTSLHASWTDLVGTASYWYAMGTSPEDPGTGYIVDWTYNGTNTSVTRTGLNLAYSEATSYYFYVKRVNSAGCWAIGTSDGIVVRRVMFVKQDAASTPHDGSTWAKAYQTVQAGINAAATAGVSEVWVAQATYTECITLKSGIKLYGGFAGTETTIQARNSKTNATVLDGNRSGRVVTVESGAAASTLIDGFTIENGYSGDGPGIYCYNTSATVSNNIVRGNTGDGYHGGGLYAYNSTINAVGNVFVGNSNYYGAGLDYQSSGGQIANNTIICNAATSSWGGVYLSASSPAFSNNLIARNSGGGICNYDGGSPTFTKNIVYENGVDYSWSPAPSGDIALAIGTDLGIPGIASGDWHIDANSPCHDPDGTTLAVPIEKDIDCEDRIYADPGKATYTVDVGADEWSGDDPTPPDPAFFCVTPGGSGTMTSRGWENSANNLQTAIDEANSVGGGEVWVAGGTYTGAQARATLKPFVRIYGGFTSGDTSRSARNWQTHQTILDGSGTGPVLTVEGVVECAVDGFVIKNGGTGYSGSGIRCAKAVATIANNIVRDNNAGSSNGGGIYVWNAYADIAGNVFIDNGAYRGGAIYASDAAGRIANNTILYNTASNAGGGIYVSTGSPVLSNNIVAFNYNGGIGKGTATPVFRRNDVYGNSSYEYSWAPSYPVGTDFVPTDPGIPYSDYHDWHLGTGSDCIDPSNTALAIPMDYDIDLDDRVYGNGVDIGADEWNGDDPPPVSRVRVGFMYDICCAYSDPSFGPCRDYTDTYLKREAIAYPNEIVYSRVNTQLPDWSDNYDVIFVQMPNDGTVTPAIISELSDFVSSGRNKRIVLVGEYSLGWSSYNANLNTLADGLGMGTQFRADSTNRYDNGADRNRLCEVESDHYLMDGVGYLWDAATDYFIATGSNAWSLWANPLAYIYEQSASEQPWIVEEDTAAAGSRIAIHDSCLFISAYNNYYDTVPNRNFRFVYNLCTQFPD